MALIDTFTQFRLSICILQLIASNKASKPSNSQTIRALNRVDLIFQMQQKKWDVSVQNINCFIDKLAKESVVEIVGTKAEPGKWWVFLVPEDGEDRLDEEVKRYSSG